MNKTKRTKAEQQELLAYIRNNYVYDADNGGIRNEKSGYLLKGHRHCTGPYLFVFFKCKGVKYVVDIHRAIWVLCKGRWPKETIDHLDNNPLNNRIENLRECSQSDNNLNTLLPWRPNAETGVPGVSSYGAGYRTMVRGRKMTFHDRYEAFFWATMCGKRYLNNDRQ